MSLEGNWELRVQAPDGEFKGTLTLTGDRVLSGQLTNTLGTIGFTGSRDGDKIEFSYVMDERMGRANGMLAEFVGNVSTDEIAGDMLIESKVYGPWIATRA